MTTSLQEQVYTHKRHSRPYVKKLGHYSAPSKILGFYNTPNKLLGFYNGVGGGTSTPVGELHK